ncbi:hypothetical protein ACFPU0_13200 [Pseudomonas sp. GCM10022186]|uniref:hypothetical protein n=1 Tax=Pseudomonas sp. GCM10022186 TaxID=3252650 RepID=UPI003614FE47
MLKQTLALGAMLLSTSIFAETSYICVADIGAALFFDKKTNTWQGTGISNPTKKYIISKPDKKFGDKFQWVITEVGDDNPFNFCEDDFYENGQLYCDDFYYVMVNRVNGRFLLIYPRGYWSDNLNAKEGEIGRQGDNTPYMLAGKCSPI